MSIVFSVQLFFFCCASNAFLGFSVASVSRKCRKREYNFKRQRMKNFTIFSFAFCSKHIPFYLTEHNIRILLSVAQSKRNCQSILPSVKFWCFATRYKKGKWLWTGGRKRVWEKRKLYKIKLNEKLPVRLQSIDRVTAAVSLQPLPTSSDHKTDQHVHV